MIVYHGSKHNFKTLRIRKDLTKNSTKENEGYGIYFSLDKSVAQSYGQYLYTIEIADKWFVDMRRRDVCRAYVNKLSRDLYQAFGFRLERYVNVATLVDYIQHGGIAVSGIGREVELLLDSSEDFYLGPGRKSQKIFAWLNKWAGVPKAYLFTYHIKDCGIIRDVSPEVARIISKERSYG